MADERDEQRIEPAKGAPEVEQRDDFLARWSRRKTIAREGGELPEQPPAPDAETVPPTTIDAADAGGEPGDDAVEPVPELPPLESLDEDSDYSAFLHADVSADVQRQALRKLFRSPKFNVRDGLDDYDLDYSQPEPLGNIVTAEMRHRIRQEMERLVGVDGDDAGEESGAALTADTSLDDQPDKETEPGTDHERTETS